ncbi:MAG TPA: glycosyltransferase [Gemmatimonadales bacterium]
MASPIPRLSLVIPAYNEERYLSRLLDTVDAARTRYAMAGGTMEIIVADNGSTDTTAAIAAARGCRVARVEIRNIGAVRNGGARLARGELIAFVDADIQVHPDTFVAIDHFLSSDAVAGGTTSATLDRWTPGLVSLFAIFWLLAWLTRVDTGVVFCRRADFELIGGYDERRRVAEDVAFLVALWQLAWRRGQWVVRIPRVKAVWSTRKWDHFGDWHYFKMIRYGRDLWLNRGDGAKFVDEYWYRPKR